jgi:predicted phosphoadenosine phosphosulfate sulfurtransferase
MTVCTTYRNAVIGVRQSETLRRFHVFRQSLRARRLNNRPPGQRL